MTTSRFAYAAQTNRFFAAPELAAQAFAIMGTPFDRAGLAPVVAQIRQRLGNRPCYLTLDIDRLDPVFAPGTPGPGGLTSSQVMTLLEDLSTLNSPARRSLACAKPV